MTEEKTNVVGDRNIFYASVFKDELEGFGITPETTTSEAKTLLRKAMGLPERHTTGGMKTAVRKATKDASPEQLQRMLKAVSEQEVAEAAEVEDKEVVSQE